MRFSRLVVESVRGIASAEVTFGPGLNVLYGPNDLGKSTLAAALRAALLLPVHSSEGAGLVTWDRDEPARVELTLLDDEERIWRVCKTFGDGPRASAEWAYSKDGSSFATDAKGREVDGKLRALLRWGIPSPGGKGSPHGLPESFLAKVLLAEQTEVDDILARSLAADRDETGKLRLTSALSALAQDPTLKRVIDAAQEQVDRFYSANGKRRAGAKSPFKEAADQVARWQAELDALQKREADSRLTEDRVSTLREGRTTLVLAAAAAKEAVQVASERWQRAQARSVVQAELGKAEEALGAHDRLAQELAEAKKRLVALGEARAATEKALEEADASLAAGDATLAEAKDAATAAKSADHALQREREQAEHEKKLADLALEEQRGLAERTEKERLARAEQDLLRALATEKTVLAELETRTNEAGVAERLAVARAEGARRAEGVFAFGKWQEADAAEKKAAKLVGEASTIDEQAGEAEAALGSIGEARAVPTREQLAAVRALERKLLAAEAALGGGVEVRIRPRKAIGLSSTTDGKTADHGKVVDPVVLEADRKLELRIANVVDLEIEVGGADARKQAATLRARWEDEAAPVLAAAGVTTVQELDARILEGEQATEWRRGLTEKLRTLREQARQGAARAEELKRVAQLAPSREKALEGHDRRVLAAAFAEFGEQWEVPAQQRWDAAKKQVEAAKAAAAEAVRVRDLKALEAKQARAAVEALPPVAEPGRAARELAEIVQALAAIEPKRAALQEALRQTLAAAQEQLAVVEKTVAVAVAARDTAHGKVLVCQKARDDARSEHDRSQGLVLERTSQVEKGDRPALQARVTQCREALTVLSEDVGTEAEVLAAEERLQQAERDLVSLTRELDQAEGALQRVGGAPLRDEVTRVREALDLAKGRSASVDLDAQAWQLLRDTLREVEKTEGTHLGRALAAPVTERLAELTGQRYGAVEIDPHLQTTGVGGFAKAAASEVLEALSVGTKDQLATLLRLAIARHLKATLLLDDHLVHTDPARLEWFRRALRETATATQVVVLTCRPEDYLGEDEMPKEGETMRSLAAGSVQVVDLGRAIRRQRA